MGMYDYLNGEQVKCFPIAIVHYDIDFCNEDGNEEKKVLFNKMGGSLYVFNSGDEVPYRTAFYNYGKDFLVYDYYGYEDEYIIHQIKDGKLYNSLNIEKIKKKLPLNLVIDSYGNKLNIKTLTDFKSISEDYKKYVKKGYFEKLKVIHPLFDEYIETVRAGTPNESLKEEYYKQSDALKEKSLKLFNDKWIAKTSLRSNNIGYIIASILDESFDSDKMRMLLKEYKKQEENYDKLVEDYKKWAEGFLTEKHIDRILKIVEGD